MLLLLSAFGASSRAGAACLLLLAPQSFCTAVRAKEYARRYRGLRSQVLRKNAHVLYRPCSHTRPPCHLPAMYERPNEPSPTPLPQGFLNDFVRFHQRLRGVSHFAPLPPPGTCFWSSSRGDHSLVHRGSSVSWSACFWAPAFVAESSGLAFTLRWLDWDQNRTEHAPPMYHAPCSA